MFVLLLTITVIRVTFIGGDNVTLRGTTDPSWGWVDAHGQAVSKDQSTAIASEPTISSTVVGRSRTNQSSTRLGFQQGHKRCYTRYETVEGKIYFVAV
jgi:hypothetical protein